MSVVELLTELRNLDVHVALDGDRLRLDAPVGALTDAYREQLRQRKAEIVELLRTAQRLAGQQRAIVPLQPDGSGTPVFAVAGHNGDVFCYRALADHLGVDQPFFALQPPGLEESSEPLTDIESLAEFFADQIRQFRPVGRYTIAGYCAGGTVAFELAQQLNRAASQVVDRLLLFGAPYCTRYRRSFRLIADGVHFARRSVVHARALLAMPASDRRRYIVERAHALQSATPDAPLDPVMIRRRRVEEATIQAVRKYEPQAFGGHVDLMLPCESWKRSVDAPLRWSKLAATSAVFVGPDDCSGDTMLLPEHAATFAELFERARERRNRERGVGSPPDQ